MREQLHVHSHEEDAKEAKEKATATATAKGHKGKGGGGTGGRRDGAADTKPPAASAAAYGVTFHISTPAASVGGPPRTPEGPSKAHPPSTLASTLQPVDVNVSPGGLSVPSLSPAPGPAPGPVAAGFTLPTVDPLEVGHCLPILLCST